MSSDRRTYIRVHDGMPEHPKVVGLTDAAFRAYVELLCLCSAAAYDGRIRRSLAGAIGGRRVRGELLEAGLLRETPDYFELLDLDGTVWTLAAVVSIGGRTGMSASVRERVLRRDGAVCTHCGTTDGPWHIDHILPVSRGGTSALGNLQVLCEPCNRHKGALLPTEWDRFTIEHGRSGTCGRCR